MNRVAQNQRNTLTAIRITSVGLIAAFGFAVAASARFEKSMAQVAAVTQASAGEMAGLRAAALRRAAPRRTAPPRRRRRSSSWRRPASRSRTSPAVR
ncbi:hypothetical protein [Streptomyces sp. C8S0]|uniref:hypothetical protein n=1 Tax=Streptomyces sp. C8S0 TaxID=2585716 RepID=UPI001D039A2B|nr:hypothetical protein [Streptomyces sp. C8S0]